MCCVSVSTLTAVLAGTSVAGPVGHGDGEKLALAHDASSRGPSTMNGPVRAPQPSESARSSARVRMRCDYVAATSFAMSAGGVGPGAVEFGGLDALACCVSA